MNTTAQKAAAPAARIKRRTFLKAGTAAAVGSFYAAPSSASAESTAPVVISYIDGKNSKVETLEVNSDF